MLRAVEIVRLGSSRQDSKSKTMAEWTGHPRSLLVSLCLVVIFNHFSIIAKIAKIAMFDDHDDEKKGRKVLMSTNQSNALPVAAGNIGQNAVHIEEDTGRTGKQRTVGR